MCANKLYTVFAFNISLSDIHENSIQRWEVLSAGQSNYNNSYYIIIDYITDFCTQKNCTHVKNSNGYLMC